MKIEDRLQLGQGESLKLVKKYKSIYSGIMCRYFYNIFDQAGEKVGSAVYREEYDISGKRITCHTLKKYDLHEKLILRSEWGCSSKMKYLIDHSGSKDMLHLRNMLCSEK